MIFEDLEEKGEVISQSMNEKGVCRTAPATPGLLTIKVLDDNSTYSKKSDRFILLVNILMFLLNIKLQKFVSNDSVQW